MLNRVSALLTALVSASVLAAPPPHHSNSSKYSDKNPASATARSGTAAVTTRFLINKDHTADVEVTTATLDTGAGGGSGGFFPDGGWLPPGPAAAMFFSDGGTGGGDGSDGGGGGGGGGGGVGGGSGGGAPPPPCPACGSDGGSGGGSDQPFDIKKLQFKVLNANGHTVEGLVKNYNSTEGSYQHYVWNDLGRHATIQTHANLRAVTGGGTEVVIVTGVSQLRPDLGVEISAPASAKSREVVNITATIAEKNGDVGARANCSLYVDGMPRDRANGIWVDNGGRVSCAFSVVFYPVGTHTLRVVAEQVTPADWDTANNSAEKTIEIVAGPSILSASFNVYDQLYSSTSTSSDHYTYGSSPVPGPGGGPLPDGGFASDPDAGQTLMGGGDNSNAFGYLSRSQGVNAYGYINSMVSWPIAITFNLTSGAAALTASLNRTTPDYSYQWGDYSTACSSSYELGGYFYVCANSFYGTATTNMSFNRNSGEVTYYSRGHSYWWNVSGDSGSYDYDYSYNYGYGVTPLDLGDSVNMSLTAKTGGGNYVVAVTAPMYGFDYSYSYGNCYSYASPWYSTDSCYSSTFVQRGKSAFAYREGAVTQ